MGLFDLEGTEVPDNVGGRPPKEEEEEDIEEDVYGNPYSYPDNIVEAGDNIDSDKREELWDEYREEYWAEVWEKFYDEDKPIKEVIAECGEWSSTLGRTVVVNVQDLGVYDFDKEADEHKWIGEYLGRLEREVESRKSSSSDDFLSGLMDDDDDEPQSGLGALIQESM